jgi:alkylation response protein AidB-like acyl-CoA dehydrogenase
MFIRTREYDTSLDAFRAEVREFFKSNPSAPVKKKLAAGQHISRDEYDTFLKSLGERGWITGNWPKEHGGLGWSAEQSAIFRDEMGRNDAPRIVPFGTTMVGPVIYTFGTEEQRKRFLPGIIKNDTWWCQGYSEPGSGSDLASLKTRAERDGDDYIVNGQKIWTTLAHYADWIFCLVRTNNDGPKQTGISFLLIDMKTPGITVKPIITLDKGHHLNEVFFENVRVPIENRIGEEDKGWTYAKFLLANERVGVAELGKFARLVEQLKALLDGTIEGGKPLSANPTFKARVADHEVGLATLRALVNDQFAQAQATGETSLIGAAALKIRGSELQQSILQSMMDALGRHGMAYQVEALAAESDIQLVGPAESAPMIAEHLHRRAATIYGGSSEIQRNIIAKGQLGL